MCCLCPLLSLRLAGHLAKIARLDLLKGVAAVCLELSSAASKIVPVTVASAIALNDAQKARILKALPKYTNTTNFNVEFEVRVCVVCVCACACLNETQPQVEGAPNKGLAMLSLEAPWWGADPPQLCALRPVDCL